MNSYGYKNRNDIINDSSIVSNNAVALKTNLKNYILYIFTTNDKIYDTFNVSV